MVKVIPFILFLSLTRIVAPGGTWEQILALSVRPLVNTGGVTSETWLKPAEPWVLSLVSAHSEQFFLLCIFISSPLKHH